MPNIKTNRYKLAAVAIIVAALVVGFYPQVSGAQSFSDLQQEIESLNQEIDQNESRLNELRNERDSLENRLKILNAEAEQLQQKINVTEQEIRRTQEEISELEEELERTKELIQENVKVLYKQGSPSTLEILFSSENFTDFVNRQEYLDKVKSSLNDAARESVLLKEELEEKEEELNDRSEELNVQKQKLSIKQEEQRQLIAETRGEEERYKEYVANQKAELEQLMQEQAALIASSQSGGNMVDADTDYPYIHSDCFDDNGRFNGMDNPSPCDAHVDPWGFYYQQCTSYAAWRRSDIGRPLDASWGEMYMPANAKDWVNIAGERGYQVNGTPRKGAIAVNTNGRWGHVAIVEKVNNNGTVDISQFNAQLNGSFSYVSGVSSGAFSHYIHD